MLAHPSRFCLLGSFFIFLACPLVTVTDSNPIPGPSQTAAANQILPSQDSASNPNKAPQLCPSSMPSPSPPSQMSWQPTGNSIKTNSWHQGAHNLGEDRGSPGHRQRGADDCGAAGPQSQALLSRARTRHTSTIPLWGGAGHGEDLGRGHG